MLYSAAGVYPDRKKCIRCPERLASLGIMGEYLRASLKPPKTIEWWNGGPGGCRFPHDSPRLFYSKPGVVFQWNILMEYFQGNAWQQGVELSSLFPEVVTVSANKRNSFHCQKFTNIYDTFKRVIGILVMRHISAGILKRIARVIFVKILVEMCQFTRIPMTRSNVLFMLLNIWQW